MRQSSINGVLLVTANPSDEVVAALQEQGWLTSEAQNLTEARKVLASEKPAIVLVDVAFYRQQHKEVSALRASISPRTPYFILLAETYEDDMDDVEDVYVRGSAVSGLVRRIQRGVQYLNRIDLVQKAQQELAENETYVQEIAKHLVETTAQLHCEALRNQALEAERINMAKVDTIFQATGTLRHKIFNPLFAIQANTEGALRYLNFWLESGVTEVAPIIEKLDCVLQGSERIHNVVDAFSKLVVPTTQDYLPGMLMLALDEG